MLLKGKKIILGVSGGIAAYKAAELLRQYQKAGADVRVCMSPSATKFVGTATFASLSGHEVAVSIFPENGISSGSDDGWARHIHWAEWADIMVIAPCTANTLAKLVHGFSDNLLTATILALRSPLLICPTMDGEMYQAPATKNNIARAQEMGYHILEPDSGYLASGLEGKGRLPEYTEILARTAEICSNSEESTLRKSLSGKKILVTAGPTREFFDSVRFLSNPSSGKMGIAMAEAAQKLGADVELLYGPISVEIPSTLSKNQPFISANDLFELVKEKSTGADIIIMAAAVSDWQAKIRHSHKVKKDAEVSFEWEPTIDILAWLGQNKRPNQQLIGFAMETDNLLANAKNKLTRKNADWILANHLTNQPEGVFNANENEIVAVSIEENRAFKGTKKSIAFEILSYISDK
jgi:phosphopantothenoylcysteine decarboxylase/phosphopantothenate--cysteine ligase